MAEEVVQLSSCHHKMTYFELGRDKNVTCSITTAEELFAEIDLYFLDPAKEPYYKSQARAGKQVEGWFKAELNHLLSSLHEEKRLSGWGCEVTVSSGKKCDFVVTLGLRKIYIEIKALYWSEQKNNWNWAYFDPVPSKPGKPDKGYIADDVRKLSAISNEQRFCLLFVYPVPDLADWQQSVNTLIGKIWSIDKIIIRENAAIPNTAYAELLYIAKLEVVPDVAR